MRAAASSARRLDAVYCSERCRKTMRQREQRRARAADRAAGLNGEAPTQTVRLLLHMAARRGVSFERAWPVARRVVLGRVADVGEREGWQVRVDHSMPVWRRVYESRGRGTESA